MGKRDWTFSNLTDIKFRPQNLESLLLLHFLKKNAKTKDIYGYSFICLRLTLSFFSLFFPSTLWEFEHVCEGAFGIASSWS